MRSTAGRYLDLLLHHLAFALVLLVFLLLFQNDGKAADSTNNLSEAANQTITCESPDAPVNDTTSLGVPIEVNAKALQKLSSIGIDRQQVFEALSFEAWPETGGCWADPTGNFDAEIISIGTLQWNFGTGSLQLLLSKFKNSYSAVQFSNEITTLMPTYGKLLFSPGCLAVPITGECQNDIITLQNPNHTLKPPFRRELEALFSSDLMRQIQTDQFITLLGSVESDLLRLYPDPKRPPTLRDIKWAIDTKVQQGHFPSDRDITRVRAELSNISLASRKEAFVSLITWYQGLCESADQGGIDLDCQHNVNVWLSQTPVIMAVSANSQDELELLYFTYLRSRTATGLSGYWQALAFQRRARIALGVGTVGGSDIPSQFQPPLTQ